MTFARRGVTSSLSVGHSLEAAMSEAARWERLQTDLAAAGVVATVSARSYSYTEFGRAQFGTARSITILVPGRGLVEISDCWWRKNADVWIGWSVRLDGADGIVARSWSLTKKRSEVVAAVLEALKMAGTAVAS